MNCCGRSQYGYEYEWRQDRLQIREWPEDWSSIDGKYGPLFTATKPVGGRAASRVIGDPPLIDTCGRVSRGHGTRHGAEWKKIQAAQG